MVAGPSSGVEHLWQAVDAVGLLLAAWVWYQMFVAALAVSQPFPSKRTSGSEDLSATEAAMQRLSDLVRQYYEASCQMFPSFRSGQGKVADASGADVVQRLDQSPRDPGGRTPSQVGHCTSVPKKNCAGEPPEVVEAAVDPPNTADADAAREENEIHDRFLADAKDDEQDDARDDDAKNDDAKGDDAKDDDVKDDDAKGDDAKDDDVKDDAKDDEKDDATDDKEDDPHEENVETLEQEAKNSCDHGPDDDSQGDLKHELPEEKAETLGLETLDSHADPADPEEDTTREVVDDSSDDPKEESETVEAKEDPDAPYTDSTEHPSNKHPMERSSPSRRCDFIPDLERMSISPGGSLGPEQRRVQKVQRDDHFPDLESKDWRPSLRAAKSQARVKTHLHSGTTSAPRQGYSFYTTHERPRYS